MLTPNQLSKTPAKRVTLMHEIRHDMRMMLEMLDKGIMQDGQRRGAVALSHAQISLTPFDFFVIDRAFKHLFNDRRCLINVHVIDQHDMVDFEEGCLSFPSGICRTKRFRYLTVEYQYPDQYGELHFPKQEKFEGFPAMILQHEMEHAAGENIFDKFRNV